MPSLLTLILQVIVILVAARSLGWVFRRLNQPQVIGEMTAGILLGPSLLGWVAPDVAARLFPPESLGFLGALSQIGLLLYMFLVGIEFDPKLLRGRGKAALVTSHVSIVAPFFLGAGLALYLYTRLSDDSVTFTAFALFMGAAMSVTAFPVLARILSERDLMGTRLGALSVACAAVGDVTAWSILAIVVAIVRSSAAHQPLWITLAGSAAYVGVMLLVVRPAARRFATWYRSRGRLTPDMTAAALLLLLASAWTTEWLGIHALFGAFLMGAVMPRDPRLAEELIDRIEHVTLLLLLPLFFAFTGLRTSIGLLNSGEMWLYCGAIILAAVAGKFGGSAFAARATGLPWREAGALGILMNTRGLMELVILSIGVDLGVISPALFTMLVLMALVTTFMTTPILERIYPARLLRQDALTGDAPAGEYTVMIPVSLPSSGPSLLSAARTLVDHDRPHRLYILYLERDADQSLAVTRRRRRERDDALSPVLKAAEADDIVVRPLSFVSTDVGRDIVEVAHAKRAHLIVMGWHKPVIGRSILSGTVHEVMQNARADVAVYVERTRGPWQRVLVPYRGGPHDRCALELARRVAAAIGAQVTVLQVVPPDAAEPNEAALQTDWASLKVARNKDPVAAAVREARQGYDLTIIGVSDAWGLYPTPFAPRHERLVRDGRTSLLVVRKYQEADAATERPHDAGQAAAPAAH